MRKTVVELQKQTVDMKMLYQGLMEFSEIKELTPIVVNKLIERIEIHNNEKKHSHNNVKVDIYFTAIGLFDVPTEQELLKAVEELKNQKQLTEKSAEKKGCNPILLRLHHRSYNTSLLTRGKNTALFCMQKTTR